MESMNLFVNASGEAASPVIEQTAQVLTPQAEILPLSAGIEGMNRFFQPLQELFPLLQEYSDLEIGFGILLVICWLFAVIWTLRDAMARSENVGFQIFSALLVAVLSPVFGLPLYLAIRPLTYTWERGYWKEALQAKVIFCPHCQNAVEAEHNACVYCGESLKFSCKECDHRYYRGYFYCPECGAPNID